MTLGCSLTFESEVLSSCWVALYVGTGSDCGIHQNILLDTFIGALSTLSTIKFYAQSQPSSPQRYPSGSCLEDIKVAAGVH